jgi:hypothetical protein
MLRPWLRDSLLPAVYHRMHNRRFSRVPTSNLRRADSDAMGTPQIRMACTNRGMILGCAESNTSLMDETTSGEV